jgi:hypothetical protein
MTIDHLGSYDYLLFGFILCVFITIISIVIKPKFLLAGLLILSMPANYLIGINILDSYSGLWLIGGVTPIILIFNIIFNGKTIKLNKYHKLYFIFVIYAFAALFFPEGGPITDRLSSWFKIVNGFLFFILASNYFSDHKSLKLLPLLLTLSLLPSIIFSVYEWFDGGIEIHRWAGQEIVYMEMVKGGLSTPRLLAFGIAVSFPFLLYGIWSSYKNSSKYWYIIITIIIIVILILTYRRVAWIGTIFILFIWLFFLIHTNKYKVIIILISILVIIITMAPIEMLIMLSDISDTLNIINYLPEMFSTSKYDYLWTGRWGLFREVYLSTLGEQHVIYTIFGRGISSTISIADGKDYSLLGGHSNYFVLLFDYGILGFSIYYGLLLAILWEAIRSARNTNNYNQRLISISIIALVSSYFVMGFIEHLIWHLIAFNWMFWFMIGSALPIIIKNKAS